MSELKVYHHELRPNEYAEFYLKYEADKVIAGLKRENKRLEKEASCTFVDDCLRLRQTERKLRHQKYKRCLAMAKWCESEAYIHEHGSDYDEDLVAWFGKWYERWFKIAEQFKDKEAK